MQNIVCDLSEPCCTANWNIDDSASAKTPGNNLRQTKNCSAGSQLQPRVQSDRRAQTKVAQYHNTTFFSLFHLRGQKVWTKPTDQSLGEICRTPIELQNIGIGKYQIANFQPLRTIALNLPNASELS